MVREAAITDARRGAGAKQRAASFLLLSLLAFLLSIVSWGPPDIFAQSVASVQANRDNVRYADAFAGADACAKIQNAMNDLPATGGVVMADFSGTQVCSGGFTVGSLPFSGPSSAPTLSYVAGGTLAATTYYVKVTWMDSAGESFASPEASLAVPADDVLVVDSPASGGALSDQGWNVYVSTATGTETEQNLWDSAIAIGANWTEATSGITASGQGISAAGTDNKPVALHLGATTLVVGAPILAYASSSISGAPQGMNSYFPNATEIQAKAGANLAELVELGDGLSTSNNELQMLRNLTLDGNDPAGAQVGLLVNKSGRVTLQNVTVRNMASHGVEFLSSSNESCCAKIEQLFSLGNGGDGLYVVNTTDLFIQESEFENNGNNGVELSGGGGSRMVQNDFGGNGGAGVLMDAGSGGNWIDDSQIDNAGDGINLGTGNQNTVIGNQFTGTSGPGVADGIYSNGRWNMMVGNMFQFGTAQEFRYSINLDTGASSNTVVSNSLMGLNNVASGGGINNPNGASNTLRANWVGNSFPSLGTPETYYNNLPLRWLDSTGAAQSAMWLDGSNNINLRSPNAINFSSSGWAGPSITMSSLGNGTLTVGLGQAGQITMTGLGMLQIGGSGGPTWTSGAAAPTGACTTGSLYSDTAGASGSTLYTCVAGAWVDVK